MLEPHNHNKGKLMKKMRRQKLTLLLIGVVMAAALPGCVVTSVAPFYTEKDLVFEPALVGDWIKQGDNSDQEVWKFEKKGNLSYRFTLITAEKATLMEAHAFKLQGQVFVDVASIEKDWAIIPPHYLLKVSQVTPSLRMATFRHEWLKQLVEKDPNAIMHQIVKSGDDPGDRRVVLMAGTPHLQSFVLKYLKTADAWDSEFEMTREQAVATTLQKGGKK